MKKLYLILLINVSLTVWASDTYFEKGLSFYSPKILGQGNTFVAEANGLASFEYNPAGLVDDNGYTLFSGNFNTITNIPQLSDDILEEYNSETGSNSSTIDTTVLNFILDSDNRSLLISALIKQASEPYGNNNYANGLGYASSITTGFTNSGFGVGLLLSIDTEVYGNELLTSEMDSVLTTSLLLGYAHSIDLGIVQLDLGLSLRPMYKIRSSSKLTPVVEMLIEDSSSNTSFLKELDYLTGVGVGFDLGAKVHFKDLTAGLSLLDIMGTKTVYYENTYEDIINGNFLSTNEVVDEYITPTTLKLGLSYNPDLGSISSFVNPTVSFDYNIMFIDEASVEDYVSQGDFWTNLSLGSNIEFFSFVTARAGLNQGYVTLGLGLEFFVFEIDAAVYSKELGESVGDRQQMGAALEFAVRL